MNKNLLLLTDSYKVSHYRQYPPDAEVVYSYLESREGGLFSNTVFFGLQYYLKEYLEGKVVTREKIDEAEKLFANHFGNSDLFNKKSWEYIIENHDGKLPVLIKAVLEGTVSPIGSVLITVQNTDPKLYWLTNYLETLLVQVWYATTVATLSFYMKQMILSFLEETGDPSLIDFKLHDFGFRGVSSVESAAIGGAAHLLNFMGSDTMAALVFARDYYKSDMPGFSIPASEHSTITSWGKENEALAMGNMLESYPDGLVACVSDSYDIYNACENIWGTQLRDKVLSRNGTLVVRPDSGDPPTVVVKVLDILGNKFGYTVNEKGYRVLNPKVRVIQGDGCNLDMCKEVLGAMKKAGWSADNVTFGMGGALLQGVNRDTQRFAFKCSAIKRSGQWHDVFKLPVTDSSKASKRGRFDDSLVEVFRDGVVLKEYSFEECRGNVAEGQQVATLV